MNVFISWSGERSLIIAKALRGWLPIVIQRVRPWLSETDIGKGSVWEQEIGVQLSQTEFGIICLTPENLDSRWINFEAGALSKSIDNSSVCTYLFNLKPTDIKGPLSQFHHTKAEKEDTRRLIYTINRALKDKGVEKEIVDFVFDSSWPLLEEHFSRIPAATEKAAPLMGIEDKVDEILELTRMQAREARGFVWLSKLPQPRLPSTRNWAPDDAQILLEYYQLLLRQYALVRDEHAKANVQIEIHKLEDDEEYARQRLNSLRTFEYFELWQEYSLPLIETTKEEADEDTDS